MRDEGRKPEQVAEIFVCEIRRHPLSTWRPGLGHDVRSAETDDGESRWLGFARLFPAGNALLPGEEIVSAIENGPHRAGPRWTEGGGMISSVDHGAAEEDTGDAIRRMTNEESGIRAPPRQFRAATLSMWREHAQFNRIRGLDNLWRKGIGNKILQPRRTIAAGAPSAMEKTN